MSYFIKSKFSDEKLDTNTFSTLEEAYQFLDNQPIPLRKTYMVEYDGPTNFRRMVFEGFLKHDLEGILKPLISLDEYMAKNKENLVLAFFVENEPLAVEPLKIFCDQAKGVIETDMSDSDTYENTSIVYVEFARTEENKQNVYDLIKDVAKVANLTPDDFMVRLSNIDKEYEFSSRLLDIYFRKAIKNGTV